MSINPDILRVSTSLFEGPNLKEPKKSNKKRYPRPSKTAIFKAKVGSHSGRTLKSVKEEAAPSKWDNIRLSLNDTFFSPPTKNSFKELENFPFQRLSVSSRSNKSAQKQAEALFPQFKTFLKNTDPDFTKKELQKLLENHPDLTVKEIKEMSRELNLTWIEVLDAYKTYSSCYPARGNKVVSKAPSSKPHRMSKKLRAQLEVAIDTVRIFEAKLEVISEKRGSPLGEIFTPEMLTLAPSSIKILVNELFSKIEADTATKNLATTSSQNQVFTPQVLALIATGVTLYARASTCLHESDYNDFNQTPPQTFSACFFKS